MKIKKFASDIENGYGGYYENEVTGIYLNLWMIAKIEADTAVNKAEYLKGQYKKYRLEELKSMPYKDYLLSHEWQSKRKDALKDAEYKCQLCGAKDIELNVHHKNYERRGEELPEDLIVLCQPCHAKHHGKDSK